MAKYDADKIKAILDSGEPIFVLRAKDAFAAQTVRYYGNMTGQMKKNEAWTAELYAIAADMERWQDANDDKVRLAD